ncbi:hypothetical protein ARMSODRAFT_977504 [Armillaria solidipes]|uniref:Uncharacterized protein n=1 Tax=Armillaria solidipes TaxID=1076256 RepID=A0A2H3BU84_9AGAR|nr:hypothetical protein ARMSODRAFT_977504 [Armillaria solidipes]
MDDADSDFHEDDGTMDIDAAPAIGLLEPIWPDFDGENLQRAYEKPYSAGHPLQRLGSAFPTGIITTKSLLSVRTQPTPGNTIGEALAAGSPKQGQVLGRQLLRPSCIFPMAKVGHAEYPRRTEFTNWVML